MFLNHFSQATVLNKKKKNTTCTIWGPFTFNDVDLSVCSVVMLRKQDRPIRRDQSPDCVDTSQWSIIAACFCFENWFQQSFDYFYQCIQKLWIVCRQFLTTEQNILKVLLFSLKILSVSSICCHRHSALCRFELWLINRSPGRVKMSRSEWFTLGMK